MLIASPRHTKKDLLHWAEYERADRIHARSKMLLRNYSRCVELAKEFLRGGSAYAGVSWGKDSTVLAHMLLQIDRSIPLRFVRVEPIVNPDCDAVRDAFLKLHRGCDYREIVVECDRDELGVHATGTLDRGFEEIVSECGPRRFSGIRADESSHRMLRLMHHGVNSRNTSAPLSYLTAKDVFAMLHRNNLPVHPVYAMLGGGRWSRHHLRVASLGGQRGREYGRLEWEREYYSDVLRRIGIAD